METASQRGQGDPFPIFKEGPVYSKKAYSNNIPRIPFAMSFSDKSSGNEASAETSASTSQAALQEQRHHSRTRQRKGSLRKAALLGRGAERERKDWSPLAIPTSPTIIQTEFPESTAKGSRQHDASSIDANNTSLNPKPTSSRRTVSTNQAANSFASSASTEATEADPPTSYMSTTDEEDILQFSLLSTQLRPALSPNTIPKPYSSTATGTLRQRSIHRAKSPLSHTRGLSPSSLPAAEAEWDYADTERWGWVVLVVTWLVFVMGIGSCFGVWSWAWDVGRTPYAPPELEDDPTLPIAGYDPALIMLTGVMAWVWVFVAWLGMKYFRHAKIGGD